MPFVIEKGKISISIDNARIVVTGTPLNDRLYDFVGKRLLWMIEHRVGCVRRAV